MTDALVRDLTAALAAVPLIDPHSHIDPLAPGVADARRHPRLPLLHRTGPLRRHGPGAARRRTCRRASACRAIVGHMDRFDNTAQYAWFLDIARTFLGFDGDRVTAADADRLFDAAEQAFAQPDWEQQVFAKTNLEKVFLTNEFDDPLEGFDTAPLRPVPADRRPGLQARQAGGPAAAGEGDRRRGRRRGQPAARRSRTLFEHFTGKGAKACAISLPPDFTPAGRRRRPRRAIAPATTPRRSPGRLLDAGRVLPRVQAAVRPDDRRQPPGVPRRRLPGAGPVRPADDR